MSQVPIKVEDVTVNWLKSTLMSSLKKDVDIMDLIPIKSNGILSKSFKAKFRVANDVNVTKVFIKSTCQCQCRIQECMQSSSSGSPVGTAGAGGSGCKPRTLARTEG
jgi:histone acetyltransferase (RNA polymerase elongator complex component)